ncbi:MAG: DinB family protein [Gemmatimonadaceae bacterium]
MNAQSMLVRQLEMSYATIGKNLEGMTQEQSLIQPSDGGNCANWILGHVVNVHNGLMQVLGQDPVWDDEQLKRAGFDPIENPDQAIDWDELRDRFFASHDRCIEAINGLSDEALTAEMPAPFGGMTTRGQLLNTLAFHQGYHAGQLAVLRRIAGLPGAVKGPGQEA